MYSGECWLTLTLRMLPVLHSWMGQTAYLGVVLLVLLLQDDVPYDVPCNGGTGFGVQFQHFFQAFSLDMTDDNMLSLHFRSEIKVCNFCEWMDDWEYAWNVNLEHGLHDGTMLEQFVQELALPGLSHSSVEQALWASFHSTLSHNGSHNNYMACKRKYIMTLVVYRSCWQHWKFQWFLSPSLNLNFWDHMIMRCALRSFNFYNFTNVHTFVISTLYPLGVWAICKGLLNTSP